MRSTRQRRGKTTNPLAPLGRESLEGDVEEVLGPGDELAGVCGVGPDSYRLATTRARAGQQQAVG
ncbi:hypothetical protein [Streptomyces sp. R41]|uniref:Uncharacterized protein n=1 Tax=Streptomyces sp. R41 TaxID=3238632 RepID=A0AB39R9Q8_9ACTN